MNRTIALGVLGALVSASAWQASARERDEVDQWEARLARVRRALSPARHAYLKGDVKALRRWAAAAGRPSNRTYAAFLLTQLGDADARVTFVDSFPSTDRREFSRMDEISAATCPGPACCEGQIELICAAVSGWKGAREKLLQVREITDGSHTTDNCCGLARVTAVDPDDMLQRFVDARLAEETIHIFGEEASPVDAQKLLEYLRQKKYPPGAKEELRTRLLPILAKRATLQSQTSFEQSCSWIRCGR